MDGIIFEGRVFIKVHKTYAMDMVLIKKSK